MKLNTQIQIRKNELSMYLASLIIAIILTSTNQNETINEINDLLKTYNIDINIIKLIIQNIYNIDYITSFRTEAFTDEHKQLKSMYDEILNNTAILYKSIDLSEPVSIFATYVYMYRKGYFSHNQKFLYSSNMKDFAKLNGIDVIRGTGVCRSIASFLTDIYNQMNMNSYNMPVNVQVEILKKMKELSIITLESDEDAKKFVKIITMLTKYIKIPNHMITMVEHNDKNYIFDPTNDAFLQYYNPFKISIPTEENLFIKNTTFSLVNIIQNLMGIYPDGINIPKKINQIKKSTISYDEYEKIYLETLKNCLENDKLFQEFYNSNKNLINQIYDLSEQQPNMIKRLIPIIK